MATHEDPQATARPRSFLRKLVNPLRGLLIMLALGFAATSVGRFLQPWRYAAADTCIETDYNLGAYRNTCGHDIVMGWCADGPPEDRNACVSETLATQAVSQSWIGALPAGKGRPGWRHACKAPYLPIWGNHPDKAGLRVNRCTRVPDPEAAAG